MIVKAGDTSVPTDTPIAVYVVLKADVELNEPATQRVSFNSHTCFSFSVF